MDLSAIIFVVLALAWAVYLIPKALQHHDELASDRLVEGHSDKVRILSRRSSTTGVAEVVEVETEHVDTVERYSDLERDLAPKPRPVVDHHRQAAVRQPVTRAAARQAAQRRRRVLGLLVLALVAVWAATWLAYLPIWAPAVPGVLVVAWLVLARLSVKKMGTVRTPVAHFEDEVSDDRSVQVETRVETPRVSQDVVDLLEADSAGMPRQEVEAALADDGSLWDPLPLTLPTYVNKARARRTVRTIELTGINSSGHDQADTTLARESEVSTEASKDAEPGERKVAGA